MEPDPEPWRPIKLTEIIDPRNFKLTISPRETRQEIQSRIAREDAEAAHRRRKDLILFLAAIVGVAAIAGLCLWVAVGANSTPDDKKWATTILASIAAAAVGYLFGKSSH